jgi:hypothetical protein
MVPEYLPGNEKWRIHIMALTVANELLGGYKVFATVTPIMESQPEVQKPLPG